MMPYFFILILFTATSMSEARGVNGGMECAVCTVIFGITDQLAEIHNETILAASLRFCHLMPFLISDLCTKVVYDIEYILINSSFPSVITPDVLCYGLGFCHKDYGHDYCHLFPRPIKSFHKSVEHVKKLITFTGHSDLRTYWSKLFYDWCKLPGIQEICEIFLEGWWEMAPAFDVDNDMFSSIETARGSHWRGRDCRDWDSNFYPGRKAADSDRIYDSNCNGVLGIDQISGQSWEELLCDNSGSRGLIVLGDSVSAHFHLPETWMNPLLMSEKTFHNLTSHLMDELDWPHLSFMTGYENSSEPSLIKGKTDSLYWRMRSRNRCNHRDYQNVCRNGASSFDLLTYVENVARNPHTDNPAIVIYAAVGNDVCNSYKKTIQNMTTPVKFKENVMLVLDKLQQSLPNGSHVVLLGLVDGAFIFPTMFERIHPLGQLRHNVQYKDVYRWFTCMEIGPCVGWMSPNTTLRQFTSNRASELNHVLKNIALQYKFRNFELHFLDNPFHKVLQEWKSKGKPLWQLIDPVDSLHPSQEVQSLIIDVLWDDIIKKCPQVVGKENIHNGYIQQLFGEQGGH